MSTHQVHAMADNIFQRQGLDFRGSRSWRRLLMNAPLAELLGSGQLEALPGVLAVLTRLGGWTNPKLEKSTAWEIYTSGITDMQAADVTRVCSDRAPASQHRINVRLAGLRSMLSGRVQGWTAGEAREGGTGVCCRQLALCACMHVCVSMFVLFASPCAA
jgi:hypothetical protein